MFEQLLPFLAERPVVITISKSESDPDKLEILVEPESISSTEYYRERPAALRLVGSSESLVKIFPTAVEKYVALVMNFEADLKRLNTPYFNKAPIGSLPTEAPAEQPTAAPQPSIVADATTELMPVLAVEGRKRGRKLGSKNLPKTEAGQQSGTGESASEVETTLVETETPIRIPLVPTPAGNHPIRGNRTQEPRVVEDTASLEALDDESDINHEDIFDGGEPVIEAQTDISPSDPDLSALLGSEEDTADFFL